MWPQCCSLRPLSRLRQSPSFSGVPQALLNRKDQMNG